MLVAIIVIQLKEMGGSSRPSDSFKTNEQSAERKKGLADWMNIIKPANEEKDHWVISFMKEINSLFYFS